MQISCIKKPPEGGFLKIFLVGWQWWWCAWTIAWGYINHRIFCNIYFWWLWFTAFHNVTNLLTINGFPIHQRFYHSMGNLFVVFQDIPGHFILLIQNAAHFTVHFQLCRFRNGPATQAAHEGLL